MEAVEVALISALLNTIQNREQKILPARGLAGLTLQLLTAAGLGGMDAKGIHYTSNVASPS